MQSQRESSEERSTLVLSTNRIAQEQGGGSITVTIPKEWAEDLGIGKGTVVRVGLTMDRRILCSKHPEASDE